MEAAHEFLGATDGHFVRGWKTRRPRDERFGERKSRASPGRHAGAIRQKGAPVASPHSRGRRLLTQAKPPQGCQSEKVISRDAPPLPLFAAISVGLHLAAATLTHRAAVTPGLTFQADPQTLTGETLDVEPPPDPEPEREATEEDRVPTTGAVVRPPPQTPRSSGAPSSTRPPTGAGGAVAAPTAAFGAVGVRYATDLATTFTRAFPQAASADPVWSTSPFGVAGSAEVTVVIDEAGRLSATAVIGTPSPALRRGIERTLALLSPRVFTASAPLTRLRVTARIARDDVHDGLHGDVFALSGGSFSGDVGTAFFALPAGSGPGRRVDVELRLLP
jgi:hypothetical protein